MICWSKYPIAKMIVLFILVVQGYEEAKAIDLTKQNFSYLYDPYSPVRVQHKLTQKNGAYKLYLKLVLKNPLRKENKFEINLLTQNGYRSKVSENLEVIINRQDSTTHLMLLEYTFEVPTKFDLVLGQFLINNTYYYYDIPVNSGLLFPCSDVVPLRANGWPYFNNYIPLGNDVGFGSKVHVYEYLNQFTTSRPPMSSKDQTNSNITIDSTYTTDRYTSYKEYTLSYIQSDSSTNKGSSFITVSQHYPKFKRIEDLVGPIIYLAKKEEYERVFQSIDKKKAFDEFWLSIIPSKDRARTALKRYFTNVTSANRLFTNYKEGWRTDPGMIYIVYGYPREVERYKDKEIWVYSINGKRQNFTFAKVPNLFVQQHLVLDRDKSLSTIWLNEVGKWRKGNM